MTNAFRLAAVLLCLALGGTEVCCQTKGPFDVQEDGAFLLFHLGKLNEAKGRLREAISKIDKPAGKAWLLRDLLHVCAASYDWDCVTRSLTETRPLLDADPKVKFIYPDVIYYEAILMRWLRRDDYLEELAKLGPSAVASPVPHNTRYAQLQLALSDYYLERLDGSAADTSRSLALLGILVADPKHTFAISEALITLIEARLEGQDILGAFELMSTVNAFLSRTVPAKSVTHARYLDLTGRLLSYTNSYAIAAEALKQSQEAWNSLEIDPDAKLYRAAVTNSLASAALALAGKVKEGQHLFATNPLSRAREDILRKEQFESFGEFYFGVTDLFISAAATGKTDIRWRRLFAQDLDWKLSPLEAADFRSYQNFGLGLVDIANGQAERGRGLLIAAARQRAENFDKVLRASFEGFQLPGLVDKIVIMFGLAAAVRDGGPDNLDLMIKGSEILSRDLRQRLVDIASVMTAQPDGTARRNAETYIQLAAQKRSWELDRVRMLVENDEHATKIGGLADEYTSAIAQLSRLKTKLQQHQTEDVAGLPSRDSLQRSLKPGEAYVGYFPFIGGWGRFCITHETAIYSTANFDPAIFADIREVVLASATFPRTAAEAGRYPIHASLRIRAFLFRGLNACLSKGTHVTVALPAELAGVPLAALLVSEPPNVGGSHDLTRAHWLSNDLTFSVVISARHYLSIRSNPAQQIASRAFLGIGDPQIDEDSTKKLVSSAAYRGSLKTKFGPLEFAPLPETADEIRTAAKVFGAPSEDILLGRSAYEEALRTKPLADYDVIHFATHGLFAGDVDGLSDGALVLTPGSPTDPFDDGLLTASEVAKLSLNARLVILSACNTARYDPSQASAGGQDLQAAFTIAGVPTLIGSLWAVDSRSTQSIIERFLREWRRPGSSGASEALARSTQAFLASADAVHAHPAYWAAFTIIGNGALPAGSPLSKTRAAATEFTPLKEFASGGEILHAARVGDDVIFSMIAEFDGQKMNGIVSRRSWDGNERWRVGSREIGIGRLAVSERGIYIAGYQTREVPAPVLRAFEEDGRLRWETTLSELQGYQVSDIVADQNRVYVIAIPSLTPAGVPKDVLLLSIDSKGRLLQQIAIERQAHRGSGHVGVATLWDGRLAVAVNASSAMQPRLDKKRLSGLPSICWDDVRTTLHVFDLPNLKLLKVHPINGFRVEALAKFRNELYLGGNIADPCTYASGVAAVMRVTSKGEESLFWKDDDLFSSSVRSIVSKRARLVFAINHKRQLSLRKLQLDLNDAGAIGGYTSKRWSEDSTDKNEASFVTVNSKGEPESRIHIGAGLNLSVMGLLAANDKFLAYGSLGGMPAFTPVTSSPPAKRVTRPKSADWIDQIFGP